MRNNCIAMLLAGGQGSRLNVLTQDIAKPAVPVGGKYRIIDFPLSNCSNSGLNVVGVLTQYQPHLLSAHIGNGQPWGLDRMDGGVFILPPYSRHDNAAWYTGTANAVYQNIDFMRQFDSDYVLIISGDHVYKMDYADMIRQHRESGAEVTIAVQDIPLSEANRFGIVDCDREGRITQFTEKPKHPTGTKASLGIYIFNRKLLEECLVNDNSDSKSTNDFGKNIIPKLIQIGKRIYAYYFGGYWRDIGTIDSLWNANMDIITKEPLLDLFDPFMRVYSRNRGLPPSYVADCASITSSLITDGTKIFGTVENSVISINARIGKGAKVQNSFVMPGAVIEEGAQIKYSIIAEDCRIGKFSRIGDEPFESSNWGITVVGKGRIIGEGCYIPANYIIENDIAYTETHKTFIITKEIEKYSMSMGFADV